jgi:predicted dienelactone hydrolase
MRTLEIVILAGLAVVLLGALVPRGRRPRWLRALPALLVLLLVLHLVVEHYRWQMVPAYLLVVIIALLEWRRSKHTVEVSRRIGIVRVLAVLGGALTVGLAAFLATGVPIFSYPPPSGSFGVGSAQLFFVDRSREDPFAPGPHSPRELLAVVWYPADVAPGAKPDPFWPPGAEATVATGIPAFVFSHLPLIPSHSYAGAPISRAESKYPVIIFSHGFNGTPWQNVVQMEELASHGFIVMSLAHTYDASALIFPDGRVVRDNSRTRQSPVKPEDAAKGAELLARLGAEHDPDRIRQMWWELVAFNRQVGFYIAPSVAPWIADTRYLMDQLAVIHAGTTEGIVGPANEFAGRMDLDRLGVMGMSFGGSTAGAVCAIDPRCKAGMNMDGSQFGVVDEHPLPVPFMYFTAGWNNQFPVYLASTADLYEVHVKRSAHGNFSDLSIAMPVFQWLSTPKFEMLGKIDASDMERIMSGYVLAFFQKYLQGRSPTLLESSGTPPEFPDVVFTVREAPVQP